MILSIFLDKLIHIKVWTHKRWEHTASRTFNASYEAARRRWGRGLPWNLWFTGSTVPVINMDLMYTQHHVIFQRRLRIYAYGYYLHISLPIANNHNLLCKMKMLREHFFPSNHGYFRLLLWKMSDSTEQFWRVHRLRVICRVPTGTQRKPLLREGPSCLRF